VTRRTPPRPTQRRSKIWGNGATGKGVGAANENRCNVWQYETEYPTWYKTKKRSLIWKVTSGHACSVEPLS
jgi:hypothetical protein